MNGRLILPVLLIMQLHIPLSFSMPSASVSMPPSAPSTMPPMQQNQFPSNSQASFQQPPPAPTSASMSNSQPAQATKPSIDPQLFKDLETSLQAIEKLKQEFAKLLQELDAKLLDARKQAAEAKTISYNLLNKTQEQEAKNDYEKIRNTEKEIQQTQQFIHNEFSKNFNDKLAELKVKATQAESTIKLIQAAKAAHPTQPTPTASPTSPLPTTTAGQSANLSQNAQSSTNTTQKQTPEATPAGVVDSVTSGVASIVRQFKNFFMGGTEDDVKKKTIISTEPIPTNPSQRAQEATMMVQKMEQSLQQIDTSRSSIQQYMQTITQSTQYIDGLANTNLETAKILVNSKKVQTPTIEPKWKQIMLRVVSNTIDAIAIVVTGIYTLLNNTMGNFIRSFIKDVSKKVAEQPTTRQKPAAL
ncbi:hypothetical protein FJ364_02955 [Candidatus Dependentiae bacterium]|nr:hypothetical protein [Candidatus Dependentiae bacterium]